MRDSDLIEHRALRDETRLLVEGQGVCLRVQIDLGHSSARGFVDELLQ